LEAKGGWSLCALCSFERQGKSLRVESTKCVVQGRMGGTTVGSWRSKEAVGLWICVEPQPWIIVIAHYSVRGSKVTSMRAKSSSCAAQSGPGEVEFAIGKIFLK